MTDNNVYDDSQIICIKDTNFYCKYNWNTGDLLDSNNYKIRITITSSPIAPPQVESDYFMIDNTSPTISNNFPDNNKWINPEIVKFSFVVSDATSGVDENSIIFRVLGNDYNIDSGKVDYNAVSGVVDFNSTGIDFNNGEMYTLTIDVNDFAKNKSTMDLNFWVDKNNPTITKFEVEEITNKQKPDFNIVAEDQEGLSGLNKMYFSCNNTMDIANWKSADYSDTYNDFNITDPTYGCNSSDGNKTIYLRVQDLAGNYSAIMDKNTNYDTSKPIVSMTRSDNNLWANNPVDVNITCTDASPTKIKYWLNGNLTTSDKNHVSFTINQDKNHELIYYCEDKVLNSDGNHYAYIGIDINGPYPINFSLPIAQNTTDVNLFWSETLPLSDVNFIVWKKKDTDSDFNKIFGPTPNNNHIDTNTALDQNYCYKIQSINQFGRDTNSDTYCVFIDLNSPIINNVTASPSNNNVTISVNATDKMVVE